MKENRVISIPCRLCGTSFRSAYGLLHHLESCQCTEEELTELQYTCEHCEKVMRTKLKMPSHFKDCKVFNYKQDESTATTSLENLNTIIEESTNLGRIKRQSVIKAEKKFKERFDEDIEDESYVKSYKSAGGGVHLRWKSEIKKKGIGKCLGKGCEFSSTEIQQLFSHHTKCEKVIRSGFACILCKFIDADKSVVLQHVREKHATANLNKYEPSGSEAEIVEESSSEDEELEKDNSVEKKSSKMKIAIDTFWRNIGAENSKNSIRNCSRFAEEFYKSNCTKSILYPYCVPHIRKELPITALDTYKSDGETSMSFYYEIDPTFCDSFGQCAKPTSWKKLKYLQTETLQEEVLTYLGGPVTSLAWVPLEENKSSSQFLAAAYKKDLNKYTRQLNPEKQKILLLILDIGTSNSIKTGQSTEIKILYGVPFDTGPLHDIKFLPTGGYNLELNRLGLVAIADTQNQINIYSLPLKAPKNCDNFRDSYSILDLRPNIILSVNFENNLDNTLLNSSQFVCISWSQFKGHNIIAGGMSNGFVAIWDISEEDNINMRQKEDGVRHFIPYCYFQVTDKPIKELDFHYDTNGPRWLITGSQSKEVKIFDLEDASFPHPVTVEILRSTCETLSWPIYWENPIIGYGDESYRLYGGFYSFSPMSVLYRHRKSLRNPVGVTYLDFNNWQNTCYAGQQNGDLIVFLCRNWSLDVTSKSCYDRKYMSLSEVVSLGEEKPSDDKDKSKISDTDFELFDPDYKNKYGIILTKLKECNKQTSIALASEGRCPPFWQDQYVKINKIHCNPNYSGRQLSAIGYENGFLRILYFDLESVYR